MPYFTLKCGCVSGTGLGTFRLIKMIVWFTYSGIFLHTPITCPPVRAFLFIDSDELHWFIKNVNCILFDNSVLPVLRICVYKPRGKQLSPSLNFDTGLFINLRSPSVLAVWLCVCQGTEGRRDSLAQLEEFQALSKG